MESGNFPICRLCTKVCVCFVNMHDSYARTGVPVWMIIEDVVQYQIHPEDGLPRSICIGCYDKLTEFKNFKSMCVNSRAKLIKTIPSHARRRACGASSAVGRPEVPVDGELGKEESGAGDVKPDVLQLNISEAKSNEEGREGFLNGDVEEDGVPPIGESSNCSPRHSDDESIETHEMEFVDEMKPLIAQWEAERLAAAQDDCPSRSQFTEDEEEDFKLFLEDEDVETAEAPPNPIPVEADSDDVSTRVVEDVRMVVEEAAPNTTEDKDVGNEDDEDNLSCIIEWGEDPDKPPEDPSSKEPVESTVTGVTESISVPEGGTSKEGSGQGTSKKHAEEKHTDSSEDSLDPFGEAEKVVKKSLQCPKCEKKYKDLGSFRLHVNEHKYGRITECKMCGKKYLTQSHLKRHMQTHSTVKVKCTICAKEYKNENSLRFHMKHHGEKKHECDKCGKKFFSELCMREHRRIHDKLKIYGCDVCSMSFHTNNALQIHKFSHKGGRPKKHACTQCERKFTSPRGLEAHLKIHQGTIPFPCDQCDKCYRQKSNLQSHIRSAHSGRSKHSVLQCDERGRQYSRLGSLRRQKKSSRTGLKQFKCDDCDQAFTRKHNLVSHIMKKHSSL